MTTKLFSELGLSADILKAIDKLGFEQAAPIQAEAIPVLMQGRDVVGQSMTGSGKTAAFGIPAIEKVDAQRRDTQVLILCPTRELAVQVCEEIHKLSLFKRGVHALPIYGGQSYERQFMGLKQGAHIVIGTPGRVMDHMRRGTLRLDNVRMAILDEADVMLNMGFRDDIEVILQAIPATRQTVFFSATMPRAIQELIQKYSRDAQNIRIEQKTLTVPTVEQSYYEVDRRFKIELLTRLIDIHDLKLGIIFCNTKRMVDDLVDHLNMQGYSADRLHGDMSQGMRDRVMNKFRKSGLEFLVATDVAARGIDVDDVQVVFNYDLPYDVEDYLHRVGRTGRAGKSGRAISFVSGREMFQVQQIERYTKVRIQRAKVPTQDEVEAARSNAFLDKVRATLLAGEFERQDSLIERLLEEGHTSTDISSALLHLLQHGNEAHAPQPTTRDEPPARQERQERSSYRDRSYERDDAPSYRDRSYERDDAPSYRDRGNERDAAPASRAQRPARYVVEDAPARAPFKPMDPVAPTRAPFKVTDPAAPARPVTAPKPAAPKLKPVITPGPGAAAAAAALAAASAVAPAVVSTPAPISAPVAAPAAQPKAPAPAPKPAAATPVAPAAAVDAIAGESVVMPPKAPAKIQPKSPTQLRARKPSRHTPDEQTRLYMNVGEEMGITSTDIVNAISGETGLAPTVVGAVDIRERHLFVDVAAEHANAIIAKLNRSRIKEQKLKVKLA